MPKPMITAPIKTLPRRSPNAGASPRMTPGPGPATSSGPGVYLPAYGGPNCRFTCGSQCQSVSCSGLNTSQCLSIRQRCRMGCRSRC
jgi:hypothetical protein